jgi:cbb3-type cytochrome oxidase subunit 3
MEEPDVSMKKYQIAAILAIFLILVGLVVYAYFEQEKISAKNEAIISKDNVENSEENLDEDSEEENDESQITLSTSKGEELNFNSEIVQSLFPLTGAFPGNDMRYFAKIKNADSSNMSNDFILKTAWAKVTKEDWADSYTAENEILSIDASILDNYVKEIFGNIEYQKTDFSNRDLTLENNSSTSLYNVTYNAEEDKFYIDFVGGDGVEDSYILPMYQTATKYSDRIEISVRALYIKNLGQSQNADGTYDFSYIAYQHYNFETKSFVGRLTDTLSDIYDGVDEITEEPILNKAIQAINIQSLENYTFVYKLNEETNTYEFSSLSYK